MSINKLLVTRVERIGIFYLSRNYLTQILMLLSLYILKTRIVFANHNIEHAFIPASQALPRPVDYYSASFGNLTIAKFAKIETVPMWILLHIGIILLIGFVSFFFLAKSNLIPKELGLLILVTLSSTTQLPANIGNYDPILFLGIIFLLFLTINLFG